MRKLTLTLLTVSVLLIPTACQTTKRLAIVDTATLCLALKRSDILPVLTDAEKALIREHFGKPSKDTMKTPRAIMREIGC